MKTFRNTVAGAVAAFVTFPALADTRIVYVDEATGAEQSVFTIADGKVRIDNADDASYTLFDSRSGKLTSVDTHEKSYVVMDKETMEKLSGQVSEAMKKMRSQLEKMPPEQRAMMEKMMGGMVGAGGKALETKVDRTGKTMEKGGHECRQVFFSVGNMSRSEVCVVDADEIDVPDDDRATLYAAFEQMQAVAEEMMEGIGLDFSYDLEALGGMPVYTKQDNERAGDVLDSVTHEDIDASVFEVPEGYSEERINPAQ